MPAQGKGPPSGDPDPGPAAGNQDLRPGNGPPWRREHLSDVLTRIAGDTSRDRLSVTDLLILLEGRATAGLLLLFAFPNILPMPPGTSGILGLPLVYLSFKMMLGQRPWLPRFIAQRSLPRADFAAILARCAPALVRAERLLIPRILPLSSPLAVRLVGGLCLGLSIVLLLPIPLGNMLPALALAILALGVLERDGLWIVGGGLLAILAFAIIWGVIWAFIRGLSLLFA